ncbi:MAG: hypothetical protein U0414_05680 [Polyangiaceae bacterium]
MKRALVFAVVLVVWACSPGRRESKHYAAGGSWPGLSPSAPRERPVKQREPRRYGRRAYAANSAAERGDDRERDVTALSSARTEAEIEAIEAE